VANARVRTIGTRNLVDAARAAGTRRIVAQSIAFGYQNGALPATEDVTLRAGLAGVADLESAVAELQEWVVLRYGLFYGSGSWYFPGGAIAECARAGELVADESVTSFVHIATPRRRRPSPRSTGRAGPSTPTAHCLRAHPTSALWGSRTSHKLLASGDRRSSAFGHDRRCVAAAVESDLPADARTGHADGPLLLHQRR
jgi:hypothetical protein